MLHIFLLTRPVRGATEALNMAIKALEISTHTPRAGRDLEVENHMTEWQISTHTPRAGRDRNRHTIQIFFSNFYSHAPCGARLNALSSNFACSRFLLTRPVRGATATYSTCSYRVSYIQEADSKIIAKYMINLNILHDPAIKSRRTCLSFMHHNTFACYSP